MSSRALILTTLAGGGAAIAAAQPPQFVIASTPLEKYIEVYEASRKK